MLDIIDFVTARGGNPNAVRESQRKRHAPEAVVDEVIALYEDHRQSEPSLHISLTKSNVCHVAQYAATQIGSQINAIQKAIGLKKKVSLMISL